MTLSELNELSSDYRIHIWNEDIDYEVDYRNSESKYPALAYLPEEVQYAKVRAIYAEEKGKLAVLIERH